MHRRPPEEGVAAHAEAGSEFDIADDRLTIGHQRQRPVEAFDGGARDVDPVELPFERPGIGGKLLIHFKIGADGTVQAGNTTTASGTTLHNDGVEQCVKSNVNRLKFPAKGGVANLTRAMAAQLAPHRIRVNGIVPNKIANGITSCAVCGIFSAAISRRTPQFACARPPPRRNSSR